MDSYQNKMLVLTICMNLLSSSFTLMQLFLKHPLGTKKKLTREKHFLLSSKNSQFNKKRKRKRNYPKSLV